MQDCPPDQSGDRVDCQALTGGFRACSCALALVAKHCRARNEEYGMKIDIQVRPMKFDDVPEGTFFKVMRRTEPFFGMAVTDSEGKKAALAFARVTQHSGMPWVVEGGLPNDVIATFPNTISKAEWSAATEPTDGYGAIISTAKGFYIRAAAAVGYSMTFDLATGIAAPISENDKPVIVYNEWRVGHDEGDIFKSIFDFPISP
jgi:hypothetical protein